MWTEAVEWLIACFCTDFQEVGLFWRIFCLFFWWDCGMYTRIKIRILFQHWQEFDFDSCWRLFLLRYLRLVLAHFTAEHRERWVVCQSVRPDEMWVRCDDADSSRLSLIQPHELIPSSLFAAVALRISSGSKAFVQTFSIVWKWLLRALLISGLQESEMQSARDMATSDFLLLSSSWLSLLVSNTQTENLFCETCPFLMCGQTKCSSVQLVLSVLLSCSNEYFLQDSFSSKSAVRGW